MAGHRGGVPPQAHSRQVSPLVLDKFVEGRQVFHAHHARGVDAHPFDVGSRRGGDAQRGIKAGQGGHLVSRVDQVPPAVDV